MSLSTLCPVIVRDSVVDESLLLFLPLLAELGEGFLADRQGVPGLDAAREVVNSKTILE